MCSSNHSGSVVSDEKNVLPQYVFHNLEFCTFSLSLHKIKLNLCQFVDSFFSTLHYCMISFSSAPVGNKALAALVSCSHSPSTHPSSHSSVPTVYHGMKIARLLINKSQTWVKEGGGGHPTRLLLMVQQLVAGLKELVTVLTAVLPLLCMARWRNISILCI